MRLVQSDLPSLPFPEGKLTDHLVKCMCASARITPESDSSSQKPVAVTPAATEIAMEMEGCFSL